MKDRLHIVVAAFLGVVCVHLLMYAGVRAFAQQAPEGPSARPPPNPSNYHGTNRLMPSDDLLTGRRRFEAGAHSAWHIHPGGQLLHVEDGVGVVQRRGEPATVLPQDTTDFTPAGVAHWHGSAPHSHSVTAMVHFGGIGPWLEPVTHSYYADATASLSESRVPVQADASSRPPDTGNYVGVTSSLPSDDLQVARGRFEAGAYSNWHVHPRGQVVMAEEGAVLVQARGESVKMLRPGQADYAPPGVAHWHGATADSHAFIVVLGFGAPTVWLEPVTEEEYAQIPESGEL